MAEATILLVDDEQNIVDLARMYLEKEGFRVKSAADGATALAMIDRAPPALVVLDLMLPQVDGWDVCRRVRASQTYGDLPILMLTARDDDIDKIVGLELGADDYLTKPFNPRELVARVKAILRRAGPKRLAGGPVRVGDLEVYPARREVTVGEQQVALRAKEFDLLLALMQHKGIVLSREQLLDLVWGFDFPGSSAAPSHDRCNGSRRRPTLSPRGTMSRRPRSPGRPRYATWPRTLTPWRARCGPAATRNATLWPTSPTNSRRP
jgi:DNA-binding response OmpR family regulator